MIIMDTRSYYLQKFAGLESLAKKISNNISAAYGTRETLTPTESKRFTDEIDCICALLDSLMIDAGPYYQECELGGAHVNVLNALAIPYFNVNNFQKAQECYSAIIEVSNKADKTTQANDKLTRFLTETYINLSDCYIHLKNAKMAHHMVYSAINEHKKIIDKKHDEKMILVGDESSAAFINKFKAYYEARLSTSRYLQSAEFQVNSVILSKTYDATAVLCDDIDGLSVNASSVSTFQEKIMTDIERLEVAIECQTYIKELSNTLTTDKQAPDKMLQAFLGGISYLDGIKNSNNFDVQRKNQYRDLYTALHTELGNLYLRLQQVEKARDHWLQVAKYYHPKVPPPKFYIGVDLLLPRTTYIKSKLIAMRAEHLLRASNKLNDNFTVVYTHQAMQIEYLLNQEYQYSPECSRVLKSIAFHYFNKSQYAEAAIMLNESITAYNKEHQNTGMTDLDYRWAIHRYLDLFDCYVKLKNQNGMRQSYDQAVTCFRKIQLYSSSEEALMRPDRSIKLSDFVIYYEKAHTSAQFMGSLAYKNSLDALEKIQSVAEMDSIIDQIAGYSLEKQSSLTAINSEPMTDEQYRQHAQMYFSICDVKRAIEKKEYTLLDKVINAITTAIAAMKSIQTSLPHDQQFLSELHTTLADLYTAQGDYILAQKARKDGLLQTAVTTTASSSSASSQHNWLQPATFTPSSQAGNGGINWQPGMFAHQTASSVLVSENTTDDDVDMQIDDEVDEYRQDNRF